METQFLGSSYGVLTRLGLPKARAVELLSQYSGYHKKHIEKIIRGAFAPKGAQNELISEKQNKKKRESLR